MSTLTSNIIHKLETNLHKITILMMLLVLLIPEDRS